MNSLNRFSAIFLLSLPLYMSSCRNEQKSETRSSDTSKTKDAIVPANNSTSAKTPDTISEKPSPPQTVAEFLATKKLISEVDVPPLIDKAEIKTNPRFRAIEETEGPAPDISAEYSPDNLEDNSPVFTEVDQKPVFKGFSEFFDENFTPLDGLNLNNFAGTIKIGLIVDQFGNVKDVNILQSSGSAKIDAEIIKTISKTSGKWEPGKIKGKAVNTRMTLPIIIELDE